MRLTPGEEQIVYAPVSRETGEILPMFARDFGQDFFYSCPEHARSASWHGITQNREKVAIVKYRVTIERIGEATEEKTD